MEGNKVMSLSEDTRIVLAYLQNVMEERLRKHMPGLLISLNMYAYSRYGKYATQLFASSPKSFVDVIRIYFRGNEDMVKRMLRYLLKPLEDAGDTGRKAIDALVNGDEDLFLRLSTKILKDRAKKWFKGG